MTKRKVTDLLPSEAILISSDAERDAIMKLFDKEMGVFIKKHHLPKYPFYLRLRRNPIILWTHERLWLNTLVAPATDFIATEAERFNINSCKYFDLEIGCINEHCICETIPTEAEKVEVFDKQSIDSIIATFIRSQIDWYESNHDYQVATDTIRCWLDELEGKTEQTDLTRNHETK